MSITISSPSTGSSNINTGTISVTVPALSPGQYGDDSSSIPGLTDGDFIAVTPANNGFEDGLVWSCYVSATGTLTVNLINTSAVTLGGSTTNWRYIWIPA
jgi:hypothetical protein